ncbi:hypothetical protein [Hydrogenimonas sp.]|uniref:hypothetical protein n=1 Tax=Hydrogenimonas sp. TaxID=2231112 RepID=UPI0026260B51|nr:hypothetical protein [Hydrogenimonas sp.]
MYESHGDFLHQQLTVADLVGGDPKYAYIKAALYFIFGPYIAGTLVMLAFSAKGSISDLFTVVTKGDFISFFMMWAIGYEILASLFLAWAIYAIFSFNRELSKKKARRRSRSDSVKFGS